MPTAAGLMDRTDIARLREWQQAMAEADYDEALREREAAIAGHDTYERPLTDMNDSRCDYHTATVFRLPLAMVRRRRTLFGRLIGWIRR